VATKGPALDVPRDRVRESLIAMWVDIIVAEIEEESREQLAHDRVLDAQASDENLPCPTPTRCRSGSIEGAR
jgi:hypothetical protein